MTLYLLSLLSGREKMKFYFSSPQNGIENKKFFLFALSYLVHRSLVLKISTFETIIRHAPDVDGLTYRNAHEV